MAWGQWIIFKNMNVIFIEFIKELNQTAILEMMSSDMLKKQ